MGKKRSFDQGTIHKRLRMGINQGGMKMSEDTNIVEQEKKFHPNFKGAITNEEARRRRELLKANEVSQEVKIEETKKPGRKERIPFGAPRPKLSVAPREGKVRRWVNDVGGRCH